MFQKTESKSVPYRGLGISFENQIEKRNHKRPDDNHQQPDPQHDIRAQVHSEWIKNPTQHISPSNNCAITTSGVHFGNPHECVS